MAGRRPACGPATERAAGELLRQLEERLQYKNYLKASSGFPETGVAKAANVAAFIAYARNKGNVEQLFHHLAELAAIRQAISSPEQPMVTITTMLRLPKGWNGRWFLYRTVIKGLCPMNVLNGWKKSAASCMWQLHAPTISLSLCLKDAALSTLK